MREQGAVATLRVDVHGAELWEGSAPFAVAPGALVVVTDASGVVTWCCAGVERLLGRTRRELVGRRLPMSAFSEDQLEQRAAAAGVPVSPALFTLPPWCFERRGGSGPQLRQLERRQSGRPRERAANGDDQGVRWDVVDADGARRVLAVTVRRVADEGDRTTGFMAQAVDVTKEQESSALLAQALLREQEVTRRLEALDQVRNDFVATAGHELRTPLTNIVGFAELLHESADQPERCREYAAVIRRNAERLQQLAEGLVTLSTTSSPATADCGSFAPTDIGEVLARALEDLRALGMMDGPLVRMIAPTYPVTVLGDEVQLQVVMRNVIENALRFTSADGRVVCRVGVDEGEVVITVSDTGTGIPASELPHIFSPFFRGAAAHAEALPGSGLGLSIANAIVKQHDGVLTVANQQPHGCVVTLRLARAAG